MSNRSGKTLAVMSPQANRETPNHKYENDSFLSRMEKPIIKNESNHDASS